MMPVKKLLSCMFISLSVVSTCHAATCTFPLAAKKSVALALFNAVADGVETREKRAKYVIKIDDMGDKWEVFEELRDDSPSAGRNAVKVMFGGGGLEMDIDKCSAVISDAGFAK
jgi:hypothetical protein